jgi:tetratricopeptide (TPR) repeat protein
MFDLVTIITELDETEDITIENQNIILDNLTKSYELGFVDSGFSLAYFKAIYKPNEIEDAIKIYESSWKKNPKLGSFEGLGYINYKGGNFSQAELLFKKEIGLNNTETFYTANESLGILYYDQKNWLEAKKYLSIASEGGKNDARYYLAEIRRIVDKNIPDACTLYQSIKDVHDESNFANTKYCEGLRLSFPISQNVQIGTLFGRPYLGNDLYWRIPISIAEEEIIDFTGIQFRDSKRKLPWSNVPFKMEKSDIQTNALVDSFMFLSLFKDDFCPEFRIVYEAGGEVKKIWEKSESLCAV